MSDSDALMWNIEKDPLLRSTIVTVLLLDQAPDWDRLVERIERGTWLIPRMRQRVATPLLRMGPPQWSGDANFDLRYHLRRVRALRADARRGARPGPHVGDGRLRPRPPALGVHASSRGSEDGKSAMILKVHHSMTDGVGGMKLLLMLFDFERDPEGEPALDRVDAVPVFTPMDLVLERARPQPAARPRDRAAERARVVRRRPRRPRRSGRATEHEALRVAGSIARFLTPATDPHSPIMRARTLARQLGHARRAARRRSRPRRKTVGGSLNDAFVAAVLGGMRAVPRVPRREPSTICAW